MMPVTVNDEAPLIHPLDEHNLRHLGNVHPERYTNPTAKARYHMVVVGGGPGGLVVAAASAALGAKVALVERHLMGGDCLNVGCVPSKGVIRAARAWHEAQYASASFGAPPVAGTGDFGAAMRRMRRLRADLSKADSVWRFRDLGVDVFVRMLPKPDAMHAVGMFNIYEYIERFGVDPRDDPNVYGRLWRDCEDAKRTLSARRKATVACDFRGQGARVEISPSPSRASP